MNYVRGGPPACEQAATAGLRCLYGQGTWRSLTRLDRPAVLELSLPNGERFQLTLTGVTPTLAGILHVGDAEFRASPAEIGTYWSGEYLALWRPPAGIEPPLLPGTRSAAVAWLRAQLDTVLEPQPSVSEPDFYDSGLANRVRAFQESEALRVDGIAGEETLLRLKHRLRAPDVPFLSA
ncbi:MAG: peptidoglycan-binding protein, partial [Proteobacteria bacterium]|nr:peptidoglycan-binding protein [Pseudomonadota bacterium]